MKLRNLAVTACSLLSSLSLAQQGLETRVDGEWRPASYSAAELNAPGMLCIRYNNFWCIKGSSQDPWVGQEGLDDRDHAIFQTSAHGARAFFRVMNTYRYRHGLHSAREIFNRYAPASDCVGSLARDPVTGRCPQGENPTLLYARRVAESVGKTLDDDIGLFDEVGRIHFDVALALANGVVGFELGPNRRVTPELVRAGLELAELELAAAPPDQDPG